MQQSIRCAKVLGFGGSVLTSQEPTYKEPKQRKPQALSFEREEQGVPKSRQRNNSISAFWKQPNGTMQPQKLDTPIAEAALAAHVFRSVPAHHAGHQAGFPACLLSTSLLLAPVTVRPSPSVPAFEPGEERRASVGEHLQERRLSLARSGPGYDGQAGGVGCSLTGRRPPCHRGPSRGSHPATQISTIKFHPDFLAFQRLFTFGRPWTLPAIPKPTQNFLGVATLPPDSEPQRCAISFFHESAYILRAPGLFSQKYKPDAMRITQVEHTVSLCERLQRIPMPGPLP